ncbi:MAG TPA: hypothetical protein VK470_13430, partial [Bacteroidota bacterium]|nr:hypothetical protein [Bacteroidota bacterium]
MMKKYLQKFAESAAVVKNQWPDNRHLPAVKRRRLRGDVQTDASAYKTLSRIDRRKSAIAHSSADRFPRGAPWKNNRNEYLQS